MGNLISINYNNDRQTTSLRSLHEFLEVGTRYNDWFSRMSEYGFIENLDYRAITQKRVTDQGNETTYTDHEISIDMAKEIAMLQRTEKGKQARQYFIELEKKWNSPELVMARALKLANNKIVQLEEAREKDKGKVLFADSVAASYTTILIGELAKIIKQNGVDIGEKRLFKWMRENGYLINRKGIDHNSPTQKSMELELFEIKETAINHNSGYVSINKTPRVTGKGQNYFVNKFLSKAGSQWKL